MTNREPSRRRFLSYLAALGGLGALGGIAWAERKLPVVEAATGPTSTTGLQNATASPVESTTSTTAMSTTTTTTSTSTTTTTTTSTTIAPPQKVVTVVCPEAWGALPVAGGFKSHTIERLTVHHTAVVLDDNTEGPARARRHQAYHQDRGWPDLAYHFLIDAKGHVYEGRPVDAVGDTGTDYDPTSHFLVCCEGDFDKQQVPEEQLAALIEVLAWAADEFDVSPATISGHRDWAQTSCPGDDLYRYVESGFVEQAVVARLAEGGVSLELLCGNAGLQLVADIEAGQA